MNEGKHTYPIVSICCMAFNHAPYIRKCLDGFLMQEPPTGVPADEPWYEILIHDDCSTDGTDDIIREYASKFPDKIFPLYEEENQYSKGIIIDGFNYKRARGKYIAVCEGDDYWTISDKLKRQVDFMESHPDYSVCWHLARIYETYSGKLRPLYYDFDQPIEVDEDVTVEYLLRASVGQPLTEVFRRSCYNIEWQSYYPNYCDTMENFHLLLQGNGRLMKFIGGQYNLHKGGVSASISNINRSLESCLDFTQMYMHTQSPVLLPYIYKTFLWGYDLSKETNRLDEWNQYMNVLKGVSVRTWWQIKLTILKRRVCKLWR